MIERKGGRRFNSSNATISSAEEEEEEEGKYIDADDNLELNSILVDTNENNNETIPTLNEIIENNPLKALSKDNDNTINNTPERKSKPGIQRTNSPNLPRRPSNTPIEHNSNHNTPINSKIVQRDNLESTPTVIEEDEDYVYKRPSLLEKLSLQDWISLLLLVILLAMLISPRSFR